MHIKLLKVLAVCIFLLVANQQMVAQSPNKPSKEDKHALKVARKYFHAGDFKDAVVAYEKILPVFEDDPKVIFELGVSYLHSYQQPKDLEFLEASYRMEGRQNKKINYWLGRANHLNYNFGKAQEFYQLYLNQLKKFQQSQIQDIENLIEQSKYAKHLCEIPQRYIIEKVYGGINSEYSEHSPITSMDGSTLIYTSRHPNEVNNMEMDVAGEFREKIYMTTKNDSGLWNPPVLLNIDPGFKNHLATMQLFDNGTKMLLYKSTHHGDIYYAERTGDTSWTEPVPYENINSTEWEADVYLSRQNDIIFISTDRFTKDGNLNIYYSIRQEDSTWGELIDAGDVINTPFDENSPFLSNDGNTLYFSSNGHKSMGGYDVFKVERDSVTGEWSKLQNMGYPINTPDDDVYFYFGYNGWTGYTASYRTGGEGEKDIYKITFVPNVNIVGKIISGETMELMEGVEVCFTAIYSDTNFVECDLTNELDGAYNVNILSNQPYRVYFTRNGDTLDIKEYTVPFLVEGDPTYYLKDFYLFQDPDTLKTPPESSILVSGTVMDSDGNALQNVMVDLMRKNVDVFGSVQTESTGRYLFKLENNTENQPFSGSLSESHLLLANYNGLYSSVAPLKIAEDRYVGDFVFDLNAPVLRVVAKDAASQLPLDNVNAVFTNNENGQKVRYVIPARSFSIMLPNKNTGDLLNYSISFEKEGYLSEKLDYKAVVNDSKKNEVMLLMKQEESEPLLARKIEKFTEQTPQKEGILVMDENGELKKIKNVYFPFDAYQFESKYHADLDYLATILNEREDIIVKILGHADDKGSAPYNVKLSDRRARSVYNYLLGKNVSKDKLITKAMGFSKPLVSNDDEIDGREINRRVEFIVYKAVN